MLIASASGRKHGRKKLVVCGRTAFISSFGKRWGTFTDCLIQPTYVILFGYLILDTAISETIKINKKGGEREREEENEKEKKKSTGPGDLNLGTRRL